MAAKYPDIFLPDGSAKMRKAIHEYFITNSVAYKSEQAKRNQLMLSKLNNKSL